MRIPLLITHRCGQVAMYGAEGNILIEFKQATNATLDRIPAKQVEQQTPR